MSALDLALALGQPEPVYLRVQWVHALRGWAGTMGGAGTPWPREALQLIEADVGANALSGSQDVGGLAFVVSECQPACLVRRHGTEKVLVLHSAAGWWTRVQTLMGGSIWAYVMIDTRMDTWEGCK